VLFKSYDTQSIPLLLPSRVEHDLALDLGALVTRLLRIFFRRCSRCLTKNSHWLITDRDNAGAIHGYATGLDMTRRTFSSTHEKRGEKMWSNPAHSAWFTPLQKSAIAHAVKSGFL
jgi:hypothetical protein